MINSFAMSDGRENVVTRYQPKLGLNVSIDCMLTRRRNDLNAMSAKRFAQNVFFVVYTENYQN